MDQELLLLLDDDPIVYHGEADVMAGEGDVLAGEDDTLASGA